MSSDPHQGGDLSDMAVTGTKIPGDAGKLNLIPSVPRPDQLSSADTMGSDTLHGAADNATDIPRSNKDMNAHDDVLTGTGDQLPAEVQSKNLHFAPNNPSAKGHDRYAKHAKQTESDQERYAGEGAEMEAAPGEEGESQEQIRSKTGGQ